MPGTTKDKRETAMNDAPEEGPVKVKSLGYTRQGTECVSLAVLHYSKARARGALFANGNSRRGLHHLLVNAFKPPPPAQSVSPRRRYSEGARPVPAAVLEPVE